MEKYPYENDFNNINTNNKTDDINTEREQTNFESGTSNSYQTNYKSDVYSSSNNSSNPYTNFYKKADTNNVETSNMDLTNYNIANDFDNKKKEFSSTGIIGDTEYKYDCAQNFNASNNNYTQNNIPNTATRYQSPPKKQKEKKRGFSKGGTIALMLVCTIICGVAGFGGSVVGNVTNNLINGSSQSQSSTKTPTNPIPSTGTPQSNASGEALTTQQVAELVADTVVEITTETVTTGSFNQQYIESGAGSGVIISDNGYIVTNNHVINGASKINVTLRNGTTYEAKLVGTASPTLDVALIKIDAKNLKFAKTGNSDTLAVGQEIVVIGNPLGQLGGSVTDGIISALNRDLTIDGTTMNLLQTNAAINPGNSGGGMFNSQGELIGIIVAKSTGNEVEGLGFAIPINQATAVFNDLEESGYVRGNIQVGMSLVDITTEQMAMMYRVDELGVYVQAIEPQSSAYECGLQSGDRIISIDNTKVSTTQEIKDIFAKHEVGDKVVLTVARAGQTGELTLTLTESIPESIQSRDAFKGQNEQSDKGKTSDEQTAEEIFNSLF